MESKYISSKAISKAMDEYVENTDFVYEYAKRYIQSVGASQGRRLIEYKLMCKGVKKQDICLAYDALDFTHGDAACKVAEKYLKNKEITKENIQKAYRYLIGRGFSFDEASRAISNFKEME